MEDNAGDVRLTREALREADVAVELIAVPDGEQALAYLRHEGAHAGAGRPDLILLDLNLPEEERPRGARGDQGATPSCAARR